MIAGDVELRQVSLAPGHARGDEKRVIGTTRPPPRVTFCGPAEDRRVRLCPLFHAIEVALWGWRFATGRAVRCAALGGSAPTPSPSRRREGDFLRPPLTPPARGRGARLGGLPPSRSGVGILRGAHVPTPNPLTRKRAVCDSP